MSRRIDCPLCHGEGRIEESVPGGTFDQSAGTWYPLEQSRECSLCRGCGSVEAPHHENTFNATPEYAQLKQRRASKRSSTNRVVAQILGISVEELEQGDDLGRAA